MKLIDFVRKALVVVVAGAVLGAIACTNLPRPPVGPLREVTVITSHWNKIDSTVTAILQRPVPTPQPEPEFKIRVGEPGKFDTYRRFRVLFLIGTPEDTLIRQVLGSRAESLAAGDYGLFKVPNPWMKDQFALIFVARDETLLVPGLVAYTDRVRQTVRDIVLDQLARAVYIEGRIRSHEAEMSRKYSFTVDVPKRWLVNEDGAADGFIYLFGHFPDRSVFVYWQDSERVLGLDSLVELRDRLTGEHYRGDSLDREYVRADTLTFLMRPAVRLSGVWHNNRQVIGGPFVAYALNFDGRFYFVDGLVFSPGQKKLDAMGQVEAVVRTFTPR